MLALGITNVRPVFTSSGGPPGVRADVSGVPPVRPSLGRLNSRMPTRAGARREFSHGWSGVPEATLLGVCVAQGIDGAAPAGVQVQSTAASVDATRSARRELSIGRVIDGECHSVSESRTRAPSSENRRSSCVLLDLRRCLKRISDQRSRRSAPACPELASL